ncbi:hypothetical protein ACTHSL_09805 [Neisseria sp. P0008.S010]|uniref:hypothetical protein n=1 Tax=Neisseria sp. P0008.S010 TaxID=3436707 RepID=UPI003F7D2F36
MEVNYTSKVEHPSNCQGQGAVFYGQICIEFQIPNLTPLPAYSSQWHTVQTAFGLNPTRSTSGGRFLLGLT